MNLAYLQIKSLRTLGDVGGWDNRRDMGVSIAALYDPKTNQLLVSTEEELPMFLHHLDKCQLIVGYNQIEFDLELLKTYGSVRTLPDQCLDIMWEIHRYLGVRLPLASVCQGTLGYVSTISKKHTFHSDFRLGRELQPAMDCCNDVLAIAEIHQYGQKHKHVKCIDRGGKVAKAKIEWKLWREITP